MKINIIIPFLFFFSFNSCQQKNIGKQENLKIDEQKNISMKSRNSLEDILREEIKAGFSTSTDQGESPNYEVDNEYFTIEKDYFKNELSKNGYKFLSDSDFVKKVKTIFNVTLDEKIQGLNWKFKCLKEENPFITWETSYENLILLKDEKFIARVFRLPEIIDYKKYYPEIAAMENNNAIVGSTDDNYIKVNLWKDLDDLPKQRKFNQQLLISRNKYLFNDDQSQFAWLINNDEYFMKSLVTTFGYTEDKKLLKWVIENTELPLFYKYAKSEILENLGRLLWTKDCNGNIRVHQNTLDILKELSPPENNLNIMYVAEYLTNNLEENQDLNDSQKAKIAAYLLYWGEQFKYDKRYDLNQMFMGHYYHYMDDGTYEKEFIKNNYYGLPKFKEWYEAAKKEKDCFNGGAHLEDDPQPLDYESRAKYIK